MNLSSITPLVLALIIIVISAFLHIKKPGKFWLCVLLSCLVFTLPVPLLVYGIEPYFLKVVYSAGETTDKFTVLLYLTGYMFISTLLISVFTGLLVKGWPSKHS